MKKLLCMLLAMLMLFAIVPASAADGKVEISFFVGDETLTINGEAVTVEKPYVVGEGVTLVPLRVITEAFGATVEWIAESKSIVLTYPDVSILLQIDNPIAEVNGKAETLLSAPELTQNGFTMVPLRFISENFGAEVSYEDTTRKITVVKDNATTGTLVQGAVTAQYIGDSFYKWSMKNPSAMTMVEREFDGTYTKFVYDDGSGVGISVDITPDDYDFERDFNQWKSEFSDMTLVKADKNPNGTYQTMHFQAKDEYEFWDVRLYIGETYSYMTLGVNDNESPQQKTEIIEILDSFTLTYTDGDIYDLSNAKNGMRTFTSEEMKFSIDVPEEYFERATYGKQNEFGFGNPLEKVLNSRISVEIYSKSEIGSAKEVADNDYAHNKKQTNTTMVTFTEVTAKSYAHISGYEYTMRIDATAQKNLMRDFFFELGDYVYNISVSTRLPDTYANKKLDAVLNSVQAEELDTQTIGLLLRDYSDDEGTYTLKEGKWMLVVPNNFEEYATSSSEAILQHRTNGVSFYFSMAAANGGSFSDVKGAVSDAEKNAKSEGGTIVQKTIDRYIAGMRTATMTYSMTDDDGQVYYTTQFAGIKNNYAVVFVIVYPELAYCANNISEVETILSTFAIK